jgi:RNA polymerase sigma-70 factor, ECF subfamily
MTESETLFLWNSNKEKIFSQIRRKIRDTNTANDILQEVFIRFWEKNNTIKDKTKVFQWLMSVSRFIVADYFRQKDNNTINPLILEDDLKDEAENYNPDESKKLLPLIYGLPTKYRNILLFCDIYGIPHKVISELFNISISCIKTRVVRGRKLLADEMHECCVFNHDKYGNIIDCSEKKAYFECLKKFKEYIP